MTVTLEPPAVGGVLSEAMWQVEAALKALGEAHGSSSMGDILLALHRVRRRIDATAALVMERFAHGSDWAADGARSPEAWVQGRLNESYAVPRRTRLHGRVAAQFPALAAAWHDGAVSAGHVEAVDSLMHRYPALRVELVAADEGVTALARECEPRRFLEHLRALCHRLNPEAVDRGERLEKSTARLQASVTLDGFVKVDGLLDPELGARFMAALEAARRTVVLAEESGGASTGAESGDAGPRDRRPLSQRNIDALSRILDAASACTSEAALPLISGERPTINVTVSIDTLIDPDAREAGWLERFGVPATMLSAAAARQLSCDSSLRPLLVDRRGQLIAMLPKARTIHAALRRAVFMRDVRCRFPGCRQRIDEVHHIVFHSHGGPTVLANLVGLCWFHHHQVHDAGWLLEGDPGGRLHFTSPTGREASSDPPTTAEWQWERAGPPVF